MSYDKLQTVIEVTLDVAYDRTTETCFYESEEGDRWLSKMSPIWRGNWSILTASTCS